MDCSVYVLVCALYIVIPTTTATPLVSRRPYLEPSLTLYPSTKCSCTAAHIDSGHHVEAPGSTTAITAKRTTRLRGQQVLVPQLEPIRGWIRQIRDINSAEVEDGPWEKWAVIDTSLWMNRNGYDTSHHCLQCLRGTTHRAIHHMSLTIRRPSHMLVDLRVYHWGQGVVACGYMLSIYYHFKQLNRDTAIFRENLLMPEYVGSRCYVVSIGSGYAFLNRLRRAAWRGPDRDITQANWNSRLQRYRSDFRHVPVQKEGSRDVLGYVISYIIVACHE